MTQLQRVTLASGIELDVQISGPEDAPAIIFLHGFPESHRTWRHQVKHFASRFRCIVPDHIGCGFSDKPGDDRYTYTLDRRVADLTALIDHLDAVGFVLQPRIFSDSGDLSVDHQDGPILEIPV